MNKNSLLSIVIVTYNSCDVIQECLESIDLYNDIGSNLEVVIVDNSPHDNISRMIMDLNLNISVNYIHNSKNGGFGQGNNIGVLNSSGDVLFFLNPDTILIEAIFDYILMQFNKKSLTIAGCTLINREGDLNNTVGLRPEYNWLPIPPKILNILVVKFSFFLDYIYPWGADMIITRKEFIEAGMFDENIFLCNEESDVVQRLSVKNIRIFDKKIIHLEGHTITLSITRYREFIKSTRYYMQKHDYSFLYKVLVVTLIVRNRVKFFIKKSNDEDQRKYKILLNELLGR